jgi:hypothetical protein
MEQELKILDGSVPGVGTLLALLLIKMWLMRLLE